MYYFEVLLNCPISMIKSLTEIEAKAGNEFGCMGIEEYSLEENVVDDILGEKAYSGGEIPIDVINEVDNSHLYKKDSVLKYRFFFSGEEKEAELNAGNFVKYVREEFLNMDITVTRKESKDWNEEWKKSYKPIEVSSVVRIVPEWLKDREEYKDGRSIFINPGMGFGTGTHETTYLCLKFLSDLVENKSLAENGLCLDFGCGSGILGLATIKLTHYLTDFCDVDKRALDNCLQNLLLNFKEEQLNGHSLIGRERFKRAKRYDLVFANILESILIEEKDIICDSVAEGGYLVLSGILKEQVESILKTYSDLKNIARLDKGDWSCLLFKRAEK